jgi:nicotinamide-nucleotide amidase
MSSLFPAAALDAARQVLERCRSKGLRLATAESCTGGLIAACLTELPGSSAVVDRGFVVYDNAAKEALLGVSTASLARHGAVSERVAREMAEGCLQRAPVQLAIAVTGIAGPDGGTTEKPVGLVHLAVASPGAPTRHERRIFAGDRQAVRLATLIAALSLAERQLGKATIAV